MVNNSIQPAALLVVLICVVLFMSAVLWFCQNHRLYMYVLGRELGRLGAVVRSYGLPELKSEYFIVKYYPGDKKQAQMVLEAAEKFIKPVADKLNYTPHRKEIIIVYPSREKLNAYFGWPADESAMGVYWAGTIRVLAPGEWIDAENDEQAWNEFISKGPMAHELAHLMVDYRTRGNYNRWFTEGVAQYVELELTGFRFREEAGNLKNQRYSFQQLTENFDALPNQSLAYRQSLAAVYYIVNKYGYAALAEIIDQLGRGCTLSQALIETCSMDLSQFEDQLNIWLNDNWNIFL